MSNATRLSFGAGHLEPTRETEREREKKEKSPRNWALGARWRAGGASVTRWDAELTSVRVRVRVRVREDSQVETPMPKKRAVSAKTKAKAAPPLSKTSERPPWDGTTRNLKSMQMSSAERDYRRLAARSKNQVQVSKAFRDEWEDVTGALLL